MKCDLTFLVYLAVAVTAVIVCLSLSVIADHPSKEYREGMKAVEETREEVKEAKELLREAERRVEELEEGNEELENILGVEE